MNPNKPNKPNDPQGLLAWRAIEDGVRACLREARRLAPSGSGGTDVDQLAIVRRGIEEKFSRKAMSPLHAALVTWAHYLASEGTRRLDEVAFNTLNTYWPMVASVLVPVANDPAFLDLAGEEYAELYRQAQCLRPPGLRDRIAGRLLEFHDFLETAWSVDEVEGSIYVEGPVRERIAIHSNLITPAEYAQALVQLRTCTDLSEPEKTWYRGMLILGYRFGMRMGEVIKMQPMDIQLDGQGWIVCVQMRRSRLGGLKTNAGVRLVPRFETWSDEETECLLALRERAVLRRQDYPQVGLFASTSDPARLIDRGRATAVLHDLLRQISGDPRVRFHSLRHGFVQRQLQAVLPGPIEKETGTHADLRAPGEVIAKDEKNIKKKKNNKVAGNPTMPQPEKNTAARAWRTLHRCGSDPDLAPSHVRARWTGQADPSTRVLPAIKGMVGHAHENTYLGSYWHVADAWIPVFTAQTPMPRLSNALTAYLMNKNLHTICTYKTRKGLTKDVWHQYIETIPFSKILLAPAVPTRPMPAQVTIRSVRSVAAQALTLRALDDVLTLGKQRGGRLTGLARSFFLTRDELDTLLEAVRAVEARSSFLLYDYQAPGDLEASHDDRNDDRAEEKGSGPSLQWGRKAMHAHLEDWEKAVSELPAAQREELVEGVACWQDAYEPNAPCWLFDRMADVSTCLDGLRHVALTADRFALWYPREAGFERTDDTRARLAAYPFARIEEGEVPRKSGKLVQRRRPTVGLRWLPTEGLGDRTLNRMLFLLAVSLAFETARQARLE